MMYVCKNVLTNKDIEKVRETLKDIEWNSGHTNADKKHKNNKEAVVEDLCNDIAQLIYAHPVIQRYGLFKQLMLPRFNKYEASSKEHYSKHVDFFKQNGIRTDWSMTLFLTDPRDYEGGELIIHDLAHEPLKFKLDAGDMVLYPSGLMHEVTPVTKGERLAAISWAESEVEDFRDRAMLGNLVDVMAELENDREKNKEFIVKLASVHNGLLRKWSK